MAENSKIEWTDHTLNLWWGCTKVHEGCDNCYAAAISKRVGKNVWGNEKPRQEVKSAWANLDKFQRDALKNGVRYRVFTGSMMDIFEKPMPLLDWDGNALPYDSGSLREQLFSNIDQGKYPNLEFLLLTKRPSNINKMIPAKWKAIPPYNVMFGTSPVTQATFDQLVRQLKEVNGRRFLSVEPQIEKIELGMLTGIDWIIQGGESGYHKRPFNLDWARSMRDECKKLSIPYFFKQIDKIQAIPADLQVRMFSNEFTEHNVLDKNEACAKYT